MSDRVGKQFGGLVMIILVIISSFFVLNIIFGGGDELVRKMKLEDKIKEIKEIKSEKIEENFICLMT